MLLDRIDTLIGLVTVLAVLSCLVTALAQATQSMLRLRGRNLQRGLEALLCQAMVANQKPGKRKPIGLLVVHGVGRQEAGATVQAVVDGLRLAYPHARFGNDGDVAVMTLSERQVRLYEVHWAPVLSGEKIHGSFRIDRLQQLIWFPLLNHKHRDGFRDRYSWPLVRRWTRILYPASVVVRAVHLVLIAVVQIPQNFVRRVKEPRGDSGKSKTPICGSKAPTSSLDDWLADRLGDVFNYLDSLVGVKEAPVPDAHDAINKIFCATLARASAECGEVQILAHSMGSLVTYDALSRYKARVEAYLAPDTKADEAADADDPGDPRPKLTQLYTIGSPLEKILFFWPKAISGERGWPSAKWHNFRNRWDLISGRLYSDSLGSLRNHTVTGAGGLLTAHTGYRTHATFLRTFGPRLTRIPTVLSAGRASKCFRTLRDYGESAIVYLLIAGVAWLGIWGVYRIGKSIREFLDAPRFSWSAVSEQSLADLILTLLPYAVGTGLVIGVILLAPLAVRPASEASHDKHWRRD